MPYYIEKKVYSERARLAGHRPFVYKRLRPPYRTLQNFPRSFTGFKNLMQRIYMIYGAGRYKIFRSQFEGESPSWKMVCLVEITVDGHIKIVKRYTQWRSHPDDPQLWFKIHNRRLKFSLDMKKYLADKRRQFIEKHRRRIEALKPKPFKYVIQARTWKYER